ncbi:MAG: hypothetical protein KAJ18_11610 [Candidatus Omnitrophica bacterium]|nr:hypothetical protein [Candidatus Omnitrophota bacterium]
MEKELLKILQHSLGVDQYGQGEQYRNSFVTDLDGEDGKLCSKLVEAGFMKDFGPQKNAGGMNFFRVTDCGKDTVAIHSPKPPKLTRSKKRYQRYLKYGDWFDSFLDFLRWDGEPERSWNGGHE